MEMIDLKICIGKAVLLLSLFVTGKRMWV